MEPEATPTPTETTSTPTQADPRDRAMATADRLGWGQESGETSGAAAGAAAAGAGAAGAGARGEEADPLAALAAKVAAQLEGKGKAKGKAKEGNPSFDKEAFKTNPIAYLEQLGLDPVEVGDRLFEFASLGPEERKGRATQAELERYRKEEQDRQLRDIADKEAKDAEEAEAGYLAHLDSAKERYPLLHALDPATRMRYSYEVAQMIVDAGEDATPARLADLTERWVARLATTLPRAGAGVPKQPAVDGGRTQASAAGRASHTITNQLVAESGSQAERDLSPEGRRAAALRKAAVLGW